MKNKKNHKNYNQLINDDALTSWHYVSSSNQLYLLFNTKLQAFYFLFITRNLFATILNCETLSNKSELNLYSQVINSIKFSIC